MRGNWFNEKLSKIQYNHITGSSVVVYLSHWLFVVIAARLAIAISLPWFPALALSYFGGIGMCWLLYALLREVPWLGRFFGVGGARQKPSKPPSQSERRRTSMIMDLSKSLRHEAQDDLSHDGVLEILDDIVGDEEAEPRESEFTTLSLSAQLKSGDDSALV